MVGRRTLFIFLLSFVCIIPVFGQTLEQNLRQVYAQLPDSVQQSVRTFAARKYAQKNPSQVLHITNVQQLLAALAQLSPQQREQVLRYAQKRHNALLANQGGTVLFESVEEPRPGHPSKKGKSKTKIPDPY